MPDSFPKTVFGGVVILIEAFDRDIQVKDESSGPGIAKSGRLAPAEIIKDVVA